MAFKDNPFYYNYLFSELDLDRITIKWWQYPVLWLLPTYVQITLDGYVAYFKTFRGQYFLMKMEKFNP